MKEVEWLAYRMQIYIGNTVQLSEVAIATTFWFPSGYNFGAWQLVTRCLILEVGFWGQAIRRRRSQDRRSKRRCHGNRFWDYIRCKQGRSVNKESLSEIPFYSMFHKLPVTRKLVLCIVYGCNHNSSRFFCKFYRFPRK